MATIAPVIPIPPQPRPEDTSPLSAEGILHVAEAMFDEGITPAQLSSPALAKFIPPLAALIAARGAT